MPPIGDNKFKIMKIKFLPLLIAIFFLLPNTNFSQVPNLGVTSSFTLFTAAGAFNNLGTSTVTGDIGRNVGAFSGFPPGILVGQIHVADPISAQAASDVAIAYSYLAGLTCGLVIGTTLGNNQLLTPNIYCLGGASSLNGDLILDGQGNPNAVFIFQINGALSTSTFTNVILINSASICNVFWQINGAFALGDGSVFTGTLLVNGAISLLEGSSLLGRALSQAGAISLHNNVVTLVLNPIAPTITGSSSTTICQGDQVTLSGNPGGTWSTGATSPSITTGTAGDYFVTVTTGCGSAVSNHIQVIVNPLPLAITGPNRTICISNSSGTGASIQIGTSPIAGHSYLWTPATGLSSSAIANPIATPSATTLYTLKETILSTGCDLSHSVTITVINPPSCLISGNQGLCQGQTVQLCAPSGLTGYLWSTGATSNCTNITVPGTYFVTVTNSIGCTSVCSKSVSYAPPCLISGGTAICQGTATLLSAPTGSGTTYLWSTGSTASSIKVTVAGTYSVKVKKAGCTNTCSVVVTIYPLPGCSIAGTNGLCEGQSKQLCAPPGAAKYAWSTGGTANCINIVKAGNYAVTVTSSNGCRSVCNKSIQVIKNPTCTISGLREIWAGETTTLCATSGYLAYNWNNGAKICCITVSAPGTYVVTTTNANGCTNTCSATVVVLFQGSSTSRSDNHNSDFNNKPQTNNIDVYVYPNPFNSKATMLFQNLSKDSYVEIQLYNLSGKLISKLFEGEILKGKMNTLELNADELNPGIYFYKITNGDQVLNRKILIYK